MQKNPICNMAKLVLQVVLVKPTHRADLVNLEAAVALKVHQFHLTPDACGSTP